MSLCDENNVFLLFKDWKITLNETIKIADRCISSVDTPRT